MAVLFENISKTAKFNKPCLLLFIPLKLLVAHTLDTDCLATLNGICTKETQLRFGCCYLKMKQNITPRRAN